MKEEYIPENRPENRPRRPWWNSCPIGDLMPLLAEKDDGEVDHVLVSIKAAITDIQQQLGVDGGDANWRYRAGAAKRAMIQRLALVKTELSARSRNKQIVRDDRRVTRHEAMAALRARLDEGAEVRVVLDEMLGLLAGDLDSWDRARAGEPP